MDDTDSRASVDCNADHARDVVEMALGKALRAIEWVNPDDHVFLEELVGELVVVVVSLGRRHAIYLLHLLQVLPVAVPLHIVVLNQHLLADVVLVELLGHDVGSFCCYFAHIVIFLANDRGPRVKLGQVVHDCVLNVHVHFGEYILRARPLLHRDVGEAGDLADSVDNLVGSL